MQADPVQAHTVLGGLAALRWDDAAARRHHDIALAIDKSAAVHHNCAVSLGLLGRHDEASAAADAAVEAAPDSPLFLRSAIEWAVAAARFRHARELCVQHDRLAPDAPLAEAPVIHKLAEAIDAGAFQEPNVAEVLKLVGTVQRRASVRTIAWSVKHCPEPGYPDSFLFERRVGATADVAADMNGQLADEIVSRERLMQDPGLAFAPMFIGARLDGGHFLRHC